MNARHWVPAVGGLLVVGAFAGAGLAQQSGVAEKVGQKLDGVGREIRRDAQGVTEKVAQGLSGVGQGLRREAQVVTEGVRRRFEVVRGEVNAMGIHSRVYSRLHWDRALNGSRIEVHTLRHGGVLLRGTVPDAAAKERAVALTRDTVDVTEVFDELVPLTTPGAAVAPAPERRAR